MEAFGYRLVGNAKSLSPDYIPSLIGIDQMQVNPNGKDTYFERIDLPPAAFAITSISTTRWVSFDNLPNATRDPIVAVRAGSLAYYILLSELDEVAATLGDDELTAIVRAFPRKAAA